MKNNIKKLRLEHHLTQKELSDISGIDQALISKFETGERIPPTMVLIRLSELFEVSIDYLLDREQK